MTLFRPYLELRRLVAYSGGSPAYDERFGPGVNIIRGANSSGKSTIADFIFFILGGDVSDWKPEAERCSEVLAEVLINDAPVTLRRTISRQSKQPMMIFLDGIDRARASAADGWKVFSFPRSKDKESFSQVLFRALGMPEVRSDMESNITMHQLLRLIYVDQLSPVENLLRTEPFDTALTRAIIRDLLYGLYDDTLYLCELKLRQRWRDLEQAKAEYNSATTVLGETGHEISLDNIQKALAETEEQLSKTQAAIEEINAQSAEAVSRAKTADTQGISQQLMTARRERSLLQNSIETQQLEVEDSREFITALENRATALQDSLCAREVLGELPLSHCPHCLTPLAPPLSREVCFLCKQQIPETAGRSQALRMQQEIAFQIKESKALLVGKEHHLEELNGRLPPLIESERSLQRQYDAVMKSVRTSRDQQLDSLLVHKGTLEGQMQFLHMQAKAVGVLERLKGRIKGLGEDVQRLGIEIATKKKAQESRKNESVARIEHHALALLRADLPREDSFQTAQNVTVDFEKNTFAVDGRNQFSASSIGYLKNCIHYAIFFASLELDFFRYPRFILCDNMEDKGMEEERSRNFQRVIVDLSRRFKVNHQIIFTTSMIDPKLDTPEFCVGNKYDQNHKSLVFH